MSIKRDKYNRDILSIIALFKSYQKVIDSSLHTKEDKLIYPVLHTLADDIELKMILLLK